MKANLELLIMIVYTAHALPIRKPANGAQNNSKDSADASPDFHTLSGQSIKQLRLNFLLGLQNVMDDWKKAKEKTIFSDPSSEIKRLNTTGRSRIKDAAKVMKLTDSQINQIKENYNNSLSDTEIRISEKGTTETSVHKDISGRSKNHNEPISNIYIWSSNALTEEQWDTIKNNVQEKDDEIIYGYDVEKYDNHTSKNAEGRNRLVNTKNVIEEPKYYSFSKSEWDELKQTLHKHLIGEDEKILKVNKDPAKNINNIGRNRDEKVEAPNLPKWSFWSSYALKPSEWDQLKQNINHNEFIMNKTHNNIDPIGRERSNEGDSSINGYDRAPSAEDHINAVIVKPVTGERLYDLRKTFDWDRLLESISSRNINATDEGKGDVSIVEGSVGYNNQSNDTNENPINESQMGRSRKIGRQGIMASFLLDDDFDDEKRPDFKDVRPESNVIEKDTTVGVDENGIDSSKHTSISIQENELNLQNTDQTPINFLSDSPGNKLKNNEYTSTPSPIFSTDGILDTDTNASLQLKPNTSRENYIIQQSVESDNSSSTIAYESTTSKDDYIYTFTPSPIFSTDGILDNDTTTSLQLKPYTSRDNYIIQQSVESDNSTSIISYETSDTEEYVTESVEYENSTRENYIFKLSVLNDSSTHITSYDITDTEKYDTTEFSEYTTETPEVYNSTRETYIKIELETDSTNIMDFSTLTQNKDFDINDTTVMNDTFTINSLDKDITQYTSNYDLTTEKDYYINITSVLNENETELSLINENTTTEVYIINLSENEIAVSTAEVMNFKENNSSLYYGSTSEDGDTTTSTNDTIYFIDINSNNMLSNDSLIDLSEFVTTEDYERNLITDIFSSDTLDNVKDSLIENYSSPPIQNNISTVLQENESTTEGKSYGLFGFFGLFDKSNSKITTMNAVNDLPGNESITMSGFDLSSTTDSGSSVIKDDDGYVVKENRFDIPEDILLLTTTEALLSNNDTPIILVKETSLENTDTALNMSSEEIMMDEEMLMLTTDSLDSISDYYSTTISEELGAVLLNSNSIPTSKEYPLSVDDSLSTVDLEMNKATTNIGNEIETEIEKITVINLNEGDLGEMVSSDVTITTFDIIVEEAIGSTVQFDNIDLNISSDVDNQSEDPKNEERLETTFIPSSAADVSEEVSLNSSSEILSTTQDMEPIVIGISSATEKHPNGAPNQPQELVGNEILDIPTTARPTIIELTPVEPVSNSMPTWIILIIVLILAFIVLAVGFVVVIRIKRQTTGHVQLSP